MNFTSKKLQYVGTVLLIILINWNLSLFSQVTIGTEEKPVEGALLQLKTIQNAIGTTPNADKGLLMPRVNLSDKYELFPMLLADPTNSESGRNTEYRNNKDSLDKVHTGLLVYNTIENYKKGLCPGMNVWDGKMWKCLRYPKFGYEMICDSVKVHGIYWKGRELDESNKITSRIMVTDSKAVGETYVIQTQEIDGMKFFGEGTITSEALSAAGQSVTLYGEGIPTNYESKSFTLIANNISGETCNAKVTIVIPKKTALTIGLADTYGYNLANNKPSGRMMREAKNYGILEESVIKYEGWNIVNGGNSLSAVQLKTHLEGSNPVDIVIIGYSWNPLEDAAKVLADYTKKKGVVLMFCEENLGNEAFNRLIFNKTTIEEDILTGQDGQTYTLANIDDPILNGPFGDIRGERWGDDATYAKYLTNVPTDQVFIYSNTINANTNTGEIAGAITAYRHKTYNLIWVGEGGFNSQSEDAAAIPSNIICPFMIDNNNKPTPKTTYGPSGTKIYNSTFTANALAWAIYQAHFKGINPQND